jgi:hypothetical protein
MLFTTKKGAWSVSAIIAHYYYYWERGMHTTADPLHLMLLASEAFVVVALQAEQLLEVGLAVVFTLQ